MQPRISRHPPIWAATDGHPELGPLRPGARVGLVAPSGPPPPEQLDRCLRLLDLWGLEPVCYDSVRARHQHADYLAGSDLQRVADLQSAWCDPEIAAVFCVRGGYGAVRILDLLDVAKLGQAIPKPLFGSSDVTAIQEFWTDQLDLASWFSPMLATGALLDDEVAIDSLRRAIFEPWAGRAYSAPATTTLAPGTATGRLVGGNLSLLAMTRGARPRAASCGDRAASSGGQPGSAGRRSDYPAPVNAASADQLPTDQGRIALLEDVTEDPYRLDGYLITLLRSGWFDGVTGIALGSWTECGDLARIQPLMAELLLPLEVPILWELGFGHCRQADSIPIGVQATLVADQAPRLVLGTEAE